MQKNLLLSILVLLFCSPIKAQCPPNIVDVDADGLSYSVTYSTNAACLTGLALIGGVGASITINSEDYGASGLSCDGINEIILSSNSTPIVLAAQPVVLAWAGSTCNYTTAGVLPITLRSFTGRSQNSQTLLQWITATETNNKGFDIERSADGSRFEKIGFVAGNGTTNAQQKYLFTDKNPHAITYYRLKQIDFDGGFEYSKTIVIKSDDRDNSIVDITAYPNPSETGVFTLSGKTFDRTDAVVTNVLGQNSSVVIQNNTLDLSAMPSGAYFVRIAGETNTIRVVKE